MRMIITGIGLALAITVMYPLLLLFRLDPRIDYAEDITLGEDA